MPLYKKYESQKGFDKKVKRPSSTRDTTISNMMFGDNSKTSDKNYGKIKSKGGLTKAKTIKSTSKSKDRKK